MFDAPLTKLTLVQIAGSGIFALVLTMAFTILAYPFWNQSVRENGTIDWARLRFRLRYLSALWIICGALIFIVFEGGVAVEGGGSLNEPDSLTIMGTHPDEFMTLFSMICVLYGAVLFIFYGVRPSLARFFDEGTSKKEKWVRGAFICVFGALVIFVFNSPGSERLDACWHYGLEDVEKKVAGCSTVIDAGYSSDLASAYRERAIAYAHLDQLGRALEDFSASLEHSPNEAETYFRRARVWKMQKKYRRAIGDYSHAIGLNPSKAEYHNSMAWLLATADSADARNGEQAIHYARRAVEIKETPQTRDTLAAAFAQAGRFEEAVNEQNAAIQMEEAQGGNETPMFQKRLSLYMNKHALRCPSDACE